MDFGLSTDQREIQRTARELLSARATPERVREHAESRRHDSGLWKELCELGWPGIAVNENYGGQGLGSIELSVLCEELGRTLAPVPFLASVMAATIIEQAGSDQQRERWSTALASGERIGAVGVLDGQQAELVLSGADADLFVLLDGQGARVLDGDQVQRTTVQSIDPTRSSATVRLSAEGEQLSGDVRGGIDRCLIAISSELVGICGRALEMTVGYVKERRQFGVPVGSYQAVSHRCAQMLLDTEKARSNTALAAWTADSDPDRLAESAAMAKAVASESGREVTASAIQAHGGIGFTWEADVHWLYKRAHIDASLLGGAKTHRRALASILAAR